MKYYLKLKKVVNIIESKKISILGGFYTSVMLSSSDFKIIKPFLKDGRFFRNYVIHEVNLFYRYGHS